MSTIPLSKEEILSAHNNGTLEGLLLGHGILPLKALEYVLEDETCEKDNLLAQIETLENGLDSLHEKVEDLQEELNEKSGSL